MTDGVEFDMGEDGEASTDRRRMIKRMGAAGAAVWAAPAITSIGRASAHVSPAVCDEFRCDDAVICGHSGPFDSCICDIDLEGNQVCWEDAFCSDVDTCASGADCPPGFVCVRTCCSEPGNEAQCFPVCGSDLADRPGALHAGPRGSGL